MNEQYEKLAEEKYLSANSSYIDGDYDQAERDIKIALEAYELVCAGNAQYFTTLVDCYCLGARICFFGKKDKGGAERHLDMAVSALKKADQLDENKSRRRSLNNSLDRGDCYYKVAVIYDMIGRLEKAKESYISASAGVYIYVFTHEREEYDEETLPLAVNIYIGISGVLAQQKDFKDALLFCTKATELMEENPLVEPENYELTDIDLCIAYGAAYAGLGDYQQAENYYLQALDKSGEFFVHDSQDEGGSRARLSTACSSLCILYNSGEIAGDSEAVERMVNGILGE